MTLVSPSQVNPNDEITAASVNTPNNQLAAVINGNLDDTNIASLSGTKLNAGTVPASALVSGEALPTGAIMDYAGTSAPTGWLLCYGQSLLRTDYAALFSAIGTTYGAADGTHFSLPDIRGRVVAGKDDMGGSSANRLTNQSGGLDGDTLGGTGGAETHVLTIAQLAAHTHTLSSVTGTNANHASSITSGSSNNSGVVNNQANGTTSSTGSDTAHNNVQPTIILNKIIKY